MVSPRRSAGSHQRVVVTGIGAVTPLGNGMEQTWKALRAGRSGLGPMTVIDASPWPCRVIGEIKDFEPERIIDRKRLKSMTDTDCLAVAAARQAVEESGLDLDRVDRENIGVILGTAAGASIEETERATETLHLGGRIHPHQAVRVWPNMAAFHVAREFGLKGYNSTVCTACASSTQAIAEAAERIRHHADTPVMLAGGAESMVSRAVLAAFSAMRALATSFNDAPARAMRPFDADREGFVVGMGAAMLVLERMDHALARGARILGEILGYGNSNDAHHMAAPDPQGAGAALAMRRALQAAGLPAERVDYVNAHATSTPLGDLAETRAIKAVFGRHAYRMPVNATKSMIGHLMGAAGAVEAAVCLRSLCDGLLHPTINHETAARECDLDYVSNRARPADIEIAMSNSFGMGGQNAVLLLGRVA